MPVLRLAGSCPLLPRIALTVTSVCLEARMSVAGSCPVLPGPAPVACSGCPALPEHSVTAPRRKCRAFPGLSVPCGGISSRKPAWRFGVTECFPATALPRTYRQVEKETANSESGLPKRPEQHSVCSQGSAGHVRICGRRGVRAPRRPGLRIHTPTPQASPRIP